MHAEKLYRLTPQMICVGYCQGYFPMPDEITGEMHWYRPDPRAIIPLDGFHVSRSLRRVLNRHDYHVSYDQAFAEVIRACADRPSTWINDEIFKNYMQLHQMKAAHSVEIWQADTLIGGIYGVSFGGAFFAESMFHRRSNASKLALYYLAEHLRKKQYQLLECQFMTPHLKSLGAQTIPDEVYISLLQAAISVDTYF